MSLFINDNISSLVAQQNLNTSNSLLDQSIQRLSSGKRINSAADDPAGLAISTTLQTQIQGLNQGVQNANDGVSLTQTASTGLTQIVTALQTIRSLANEAQGGTLTTANQQALQQEVSQEIAEVNRISNTTTFNGLNLLNGTSGIINVQVGADVGQTVQLDLSQGVSAGSLGGGIAESGQVLGTISNLNLNADGTEASGAGAITQISIVSNGSGGFTFEDQNGSAISAAASASLFTTTTTNGVSSLSLNSTGALTPTNELTSISAAVAGGSGAAKGTVFGKISDIDIDPSTGLDATSSTNNAITSITVEANGSGGLQFIDQNGNAVPASATGGLFNLTTSAGGAVTGISFAATPTSTIGSTAAGAQPANSVLANVNALTTPTSVANIDVSTTVGANNAVLSIDNAIATINNLQAVIGAAQVRFQGISQSQQDESTDLSNANSQISDADFATESANLSKAQVMQQAGISVLAQANAQPQQVLKLLQ
ncbi:flagellin N-terminal helical domain-containing protein [Paraburkholderia sp. SOS3]|jgi:flagellin|uniref:flagellin N-terminal helical domain-containing protein n=1 Tax=Paraburkholderia sp. SOS3 TaxID=1926494 RepID=UPI0009477AEA|nr:flagellin [Paraburkholderia sp. SOS3]APR38758.1 flagellin [Paraburkholderia sp. SOS3]